MNWKRIQQRIGLGLLSVVVAIALLTFGALPSIAAESSNSQSETAKTLLKTAYDSRYTWDKAFPGYQAEVAVRYQDTSVQGSVCYVVHSKGHSRLQLALVQHNEPVQRTLTQH